MTLTKVKNTINLSVQYVTHYCYTIKTILKYYLLKTCFLVNNIINNSNFIKILILQYCLKYIIIFLDFLINILTYIRNYDIIEFLNYISFYIEYLIDRYYYGLTEEHFVYKCLLSVDYFDKSIKYFMKKNYKGKSLKSPFTLFLEFFPNSLMTFHLYYSIIKFILSRLYTYYLIFCYASYR